MCVPVAAKNQKINRIGNKWPILALLVLLAFFPARAQISTTAYFPEIDAYLQLNPNLQLNFQAKNELENGDLIRAQIGPSLQFYVKPLKKLKDVTIFDLDRARCMPLAISIGYRYLPSPNLPTKNRFEPVAEFHLPVKGRILLSDRNRLDLDWWSGRLTWRYRNRATLERRFTIYSYHPGPYASAEFFYENPYSKWSQTHLFAGCLLPLGKHFQFDPYYEHENKTEKSPNQQVNAGGLILSIYFSASKE